MTILTVKTPAKRKSRNLTYIFNQLIICVPTSNLEVQN